MWNTPNSETPQRNQSLERGLAVLEAFGSPRAEIGIRELGRPLGLNKSIVHRLWPARSPRAAFSSKIP